MTPYPWTKQEAALVRRLWDDEGGRKVLTMLLERMCGLSSLSMSSDPHLTSFNEGRRWVGRQLLDAIETPVELLVHEEPDERTTVVTATERARRVAAGLAPDGSTRRPV